MNNKKFVIIFLVIALVLLLAVALLFLRKSNQGDLARKEETKEFSVPSNPEEYYQNASEVEATPVPLRGVSDIDALSNEIDSTNVNIDADLKELDKDFASF